MAWFKRFVEPIVLPDGRELLTLRDAAEYITALPKAEHDAADWQVAMETLLLVAERDGPEMLARIAVMKALNRHVERVFNPDRKDTHWGKRKLKKDQRPFLSTTRASRLAIPSTSRSSPIKMPRKPSGMKEAAN